MITCMLYNILHSLCYITTTYSYIYIKQYNIYCFSNLYRYSIINLSSDCRNVVL